MIDFNSIDPKIVAAIIAAITSLITLFITALFKPLWEKYFHLFKLESEYRYEQRKRIKQILSKNKIQLLNNCDSLNHRFWNFTKNYPEGWHSIDGNYAETKNYYFNSFVFRIIVVFSWIKKIENEMLYLDTTIATKEDLEFIKFLRLLPQLLCDVSLFKSFQYDANRQTDHIFRNILEGMAESLVVDDKVITFSDYQDKIVDYSRKIAIMCRFIDGMSPDDTDRLRWDRLQIFHFALMAFLNTFGYDFQHTSKNKLKKLINQPRKSKLCDNFNLLLERNRFSSQKQLKKVLKLL